MSEITFIILVSFLFVFVILAATGLYLFITQKKCVSKKKSKEENLKDIDLGMQEVVYTKKVPIIKSENPTVILQFSIDTYPIALGICQNDHEIIYDITKFCFHNNECSIPDINGLIIEVYGEMLHTTVSTIVGVTLVSFRAYPMFIAHGIVNMDTTKEDQLSMLEQFGFCI